MTCTRQSTCFVPLLLFFLQNTRVFHWSVYLIVWLMICLKVKDFFYFSFSRLHDAINNLHGARHPRATPISVTQIYNIFSYVDDSTVSQNVQSLSEDKWTIHVKTLACSKQREYSIIIINNNLYFPENFPISNNLFYIWQIEFMLQVYAHDNI